MAFQSDVLPRFKPFSVLFADADADTRFAYHAVASAEELHVELASVGHEALALALLLLPDVLVVEAQLPEVDGFEITRRLRANAGTASLPIVLVSHDRREPGEIAARAAGCDAHLVKPCMLDDLLRLLRLLVHGRRHVGRGRGLHKVALSAGPASTSRAKGKT